MSDASGALRIDLKGEVWATWTLAKRRVNVCRLETHPIPSEELLQRASYTSSYFIAITTPEQRQSMA